MNDPVFRTLDAVRAKVPLVHCITNYVTVNDCANVLLACGASPVMADDGREAAAIAGISRGVLLNIGTLNDRTFASMLIAGKAANRRGVPVVLDPVGAGASELRSQCALRLLNEVKFAVVRGNMSEIRTLLAGNGKSSGVDACAADRITGENLDFQTAAARDFAAKYATTVAVSGAIDIVTTAKTTALVRNGHIMLTRITGSGCMLGALCAAFAAANPGDPLSAALEATVLMGIAGERAANGLEDGEGTGTFRTRLIDSIDLISEKDLQLEAKYEFFPG